MKKQTNLKKIKAVKELVRTYFKNRKDEPYKLTNGEAKIVVAVLRKSLKYVWISGPTRYGKLIANNVPVLTTNGWKKHGDLVVGDYVFNHLGKLVKVIGVAPKDVADIEVIFSNGEKIKVNEEHKWLVQHRKWKDWRVVDTNWLIKQRMKEKDGHRVFRLPKIKPLEFSKKELPVDPYTLGAWMGDGVSVSPSITIKPEDREVIENIPYKVSNEIKHKKTGVVRYDFYKTDLLRGLKELGLIKRISGGGYKGVGRKFIPEIYKRASIRQKVELLAGLIDTDGYVHKLYQDNGYRDGRVKIINSNKELIDSVAEIVRSLGMRVSITKVNACDSSSGIKGKKDIYYLGFDAEIDIPTKLSRKKITPRIKNKYVCIDEIKKTESEQGNCIKVDSEDGIYLVGEKLIPTHNTETIALAVIILAVFYKLKIPIIAGSEEKARKIMDYVLEHLGDHPELHKGLINLRGIRDIERLKVSASKNVLRWAAGGWIFITSVDMRQISKEGERAVGEGGDVVVLEEAGLIKKKEQFSKIIRMTEGEWGKLVMSGNCFENSVFETAYKSPLYYKIRIPLSQAIEEGRITEKELEAKKQQTTSKDWKRFYLVEFPKAGEYTYFKPKRYEYLPSEEMKYYGALDPALGEAKKGSLVGVVVLGRTKDGTVYEIESVGKKMKPDEAIRTIFNFSYKFQRFGIEAVQFQKYLLRTVEEKSKENKRYIPFEGIQQSKKKEERIESMEPAINTGQILFKGDNELWKEMQDYPDAENLDCLDALEMAWRTVENRSSSFPDQDKLETKYDEKAKPFSAGLMDKEF